MQASSLLSRMGARALTRMEKLSREQKSSSHSESGHTLTVMKGKTGSEGSRQGAEAGATPLGMGRPSVPLMLLLQVRSHTLEVASSTYHTEFQTSCTLSFLKRI